jgi:hypothetical protein
VIFTRETRKVLSVNNSTHKPCLICRRQCIKPDNNGRINSHGSERLLQYMLQRISKWMTIHGYACITIYLNQQWNNKRCNNKHCTWNSQKTFYINSVSILNLSLWVYFHTMRAADWHSGHCYKFHKLCWDDRNSFPSARAVVSFSQIFQTNATLMHSNHWSMSYYEFFRRRRPLRLTRRHEWACLY